MTVATEIQLRRAVAALVRDHSETLDKLAEYFKDEDFARFNAVQSSDVDGLVKIKQMADAHQTVLATIKNLAYIPDDPTVTDL